jgi:hypothetical protein
MMTQSSSKTNSVSFGFGFGLALAAMRYAIPSHVFPKHQALNLNTTASVKSAMKKITILWVAYHLAYIIFLRVFASFRPLRDCSCARPLHDMSKYFNPFFLNTLAVHSAIAL